MAKRWHCTNMPEDEFRHEVRNIIELEDQVNTANDYQRTQPWVQDRIEELRFLYEQLECLWPLTPGRGEPTERDCDGD